MQTNILAARRWWTVPLLFSTRQLDIRRNSYNNDGQQQRRRRRRRQQQRHQLHHSSSSNCCSGTDDDGNNNNNNNTQQQPTNTNTNKERTCQQRKSKDSKWCHGVGRESARRTSRTNSRRSACCALEQPTGHENTRAPTSPVVGVAAAWTWLRCEDDKFSLSVDA